MRAHRVMSDEIFFDGVRYVSAADAAETSDFTRDYVARLCREGSVKGRRIGKNWYVDETSLKTFVISQEYSRVRRGQKLVEERLHEYHDSASLQSEETTPRIQPPENAPVSVPSHATVHGAALASATKPLTDNVQKIQESFERVVANHSDTLNRIAHIASAPYGIAESAVKAVHVPVYAVTPVAEFFHKLTALTIAFMLTFGTYALVDPQYARFAMNSISESVRSTIDTYRYGNERFDSVATNAQSHL